MAYMQEMTNMDIYNNTEIIVEMERHQHRDMNFTNATEITLVFPEYIVVTNTVLYAFIFLFGILGNILVIVVVCVNRNMKTVVNMFLVNLCIADLLVLTVCMPTALLDVYAYDAWYFGKFMCYAVTFVENTVAFGSVLTLIAISVERYKVVCHPLSGMRDDVMKCARALPLLWLIAALCNTPWFAITRFRHWYRKDNTPIDLCANSMDALWKQYFAIISCVISFVIPFILLLFLYCRICYILYFTEQINLTRATSHSTRYKKRLRLQVVNIIVCLVLLFFIFHMPYRAVSVWYSIDISVINLGLETYYNILFSSRIMFYLNHAFNPIIYSFVSTKFRSALRFTMTRRQDRGSLMSSNRRCIGNTHFKQPKQSEAHLMDGGLAKNRNGVRCTTIMTSQRHNPNEFFPMYAVLVQKHESKLKYSDEFKVADSVIADGQL